MVDREHREDWRRERSLLALGQAVRGEEDASPVAIGDGANASWREDAAARHRLARSRRETRPVPPPVADTEASRYRAEPEPLPNERRAEDDWAERSGYPQAGSRLQPAGSPQQPQSAEPRYARDVRPFAGDDSDGQEWKPLIDPRQVVGGIARSKLLIVTTAILGAVLGIAVAVSTPKKYEATTQVVIEPGDLKLSDTDLTQPVGQPDAALAVVETRIKMVTSGKVLDKVVADLHLADDPEFNGQGSGGFGVMSLIRSVLSRQDASSGADDVRRQALAVRNLAESLSVERSGKTFVVSISATTQSAENSAIIANKTRDVFQEEAGKYQFEMAGRATNQLTAKLGDLRKDVEAAERKVEDFRATHDLVDAQGHLISDDQMLKLNEQLSVARARTLELNARAASARSADVNSVLTGTLPEEINSNTMSELRSQYAALKQEADRAAVRLGPRHPEYQALNAQLDGSRERIAGELRRIASSLQVDLKRAVQLEQGLASRLAQAKVQSGDVNSDLVSLRELERDATAKRSVYEQYLLRAKQTGEQENINTTNINLMTEARPPLEANGPSRAVIALAGLLLGLAFGVGLGAMRGAFASLRETAASRSRRKGDERRPAFEDRAYQAPAPAEATERSGLAGSLLSSMRAFLPGGKQKPVDTRAAENVPPARPAIQDAAGFAQPRYQQDAYAPYPGQPQMPPQAMYPAPPPQAYSPVQQPGYQQPAQMPPAGYPSQPIPTAGGERYSQAQRPQTHPEPGAPEGGQQGQIDEIRASLREFRDAVRELTESRSKRRYF